MSNYSKHHMMTKILIMMIREDNESDNYGDGRVECAIIGNSKQQG